MIEHRSSAFAATTRQRWNGFIVVLALGCPYGANAQQTPDAPRDVAEMTCPQLAAEMNDLGQQQQAASLAMQAETTKMLEAQKRQKSRAEAARRQGATSNGAAASVALLPGGGLLSGVIGAVGALHSKKGKAVNETGSTATDIREAQAAGEAAASIAIRQQGSAMRMQALLATLTARRCP